MATPLEEVPRKRSKAAHPASVDASQAEVRGPDIDVPQAPVEARSDEERRDAISRAAYRLAEERGFAPGYELDDWLAAERETDARISSRHG